MSRPDVILLMTDQERAAPEYESPELAAWRRETLAGAQWFEDHGVSFGRHYTGSLACVPSRPTLFTGQYPDVHGVTQTNGLGKWYNDSRMRWLRPTEVPTLGHWFRAGGYDTQYVGKWHMSHADLVDPATGGSLATNDDDGVVDTGAVQKYLDADPLDEFGFSGWVGPEPHGAKLADSGLVRDSIYADRAVAWLQNRYERRRAGDADAQRPFLLVVCFVNPHDIVFAPAWLARAGKNPIEAGRSDPPAVPPSPTDDEDLATKPAAQIAYRASYPSTYGPPRRSSAPTARTLKGTETCTTDSTPSPTPRSTGCAKQSPKVGPPMRCSYERRTMASCWEHTADSIRSGSTCTTKQLECRSPLLASDQTQPSPAASPMHQRRMSTWRQRCSQRPTSTPPRSSPSCRRPSPRSTHFRAAI